MNTCIIIRKFIRSMNKNLATILKRERERERMNIYSGYILDIYIEIQEAFLIEFFLKFNILYASEIFKSRLI